MLNFENIQSELFIAIITLALLFGLFSKIQQTYLIAIIIIIMLSGAVYVFLRKRSTDKTNSLENYKGLLNEDIKNRFETNESNFYIDKFPINVKYLKENMQLIDIITNIRFIKKFNKTRYSDIILNANKMMKIYIYILSDRYDAVDYIPIFIDIRDNILQLMYSLILIVPEKLKHTYALDPYQEIYNSIDNFTSYSREMLQVLENYAKIHLKEVYIPDTTFKAYDSQMTADRFP